MRCVKCDSTGHIARDCPRLVRNEIVACVRDNQGINKKAENCGVCESDKGTRAVSGVNTQQQVKW